MSTRTTLRSPNIEQRLSEAMWAYDSRDPALVQLLSDVADHLEATRNVLERIVFVQGDSHALDCVRDIARAALAEEGLR